CNTPPPKSICQKEQGCKKLNLKTRYWTRLRCDPFYKLSVIEGGIQTKAVNYEFFFCHDEGKWSVQSGSIVKHLTEEDNVYCSDPSEDPVPSRPITHTSEACRPTKLDSVCEKNDFSCERVSRRLNRN
ncbi:hypothetical protein PFISCL1PPCAC_10330, partial [Pristionchus fissidentatus]